MALPRVHMVGNLVADPELRFSASGKAVLKARVACNERKKQVDGSWADGPSCFIDVTMFDKQAEAGAEELRKGQRVMVEGRMQQREYETSAGERRSAYEVIAEDIAKVVRPKAGNQAGGGRSVSDDPWASAGGGQVPQDDEVPF